MSAHKRTTTPDTLTTEITGIVDARMRGNGQGHCHETRQRYVADALATYDNAKLLRVIHEGTAIGSGYADEARIELAERYEANADALMAKAQDLRVQVSFNGRDDPDVTRVTLTAAGREVLA